MKYQYKLCYIDDLTRELHKLISYSKMWIIHEYIKILTTRTDINSLKVYKINVNTSNTREITQEVNKFLYK